MAAFTPRVITLTTDFGHQDPYVGVVKGVILSGCPQAQIVDMNHEIPAFDIRAGAWSLKISLSYFPSGSIHIAVVDPQVGSSQRRIALQMLDCIILAPDNGLLTPFICAAQNAFVLDKPEFFRKSVSNTFHARDIFAPIAARLLNGEGLHKIATQIDTATLAQLDDFEPKTGDGFIEGTIVYCDRYGNLITNISAEEKNRISQIELGKHVLKMAKGSYDTIDDGEAKVVVGSHGYLEIAAKQASAASQLKARNGDKLIAKTAPTADNLE